jgi:sirohydrochlorin cobaltochelatase
MNSLHAAANGSIAEFLSAALESGHLQIGEVLVKKSDSGFSLRHEADAGLKELEVFHSPDDATEIARWNDKGDYRPLKTAPNLRRGWELRLGSIASLHLALDLLYPAALGNWRAVLRGEKVAPPLHETLNRQTGMYRITGLLTRDEASHIIGSLCRSGCLRRILWPIETGAAEPQVESPEGRITLFCTNPCSHFLGKAREIVKSRPATS